MKKLFVLAFLFATLFSFSQVAQRPDPPKLYNNLSKEYPNFLSESEAYTIEGKLEAFSRETSNQIVVVIVDLEGTDPASYATQLGTEWGVGKKDANNGIVVLIAPGSHDLFIAVGYGLEGAIPDLATKRIREEEMNPYLKSGDYFTAINNGTDKLMALAKGEINVKDYAKEKFNMDKWISRFRAAKTIEGQERVLIPGDPEREMEERRIRSGIPLLKVVEDDMLFLGEKFGIVL